MNRTFFIAGVQFRPKNEINEACKKIEQGSYLSLVLEPENKFDLNAVKILFDEIFLGYVPKIFSAQVAGLLEAEIELECIVEEINPSAKPWEMCKVMITEAEPGIEPLCETKRLHSPFLDSKPDIGDGPDFDSGCKEE